MSATDRDRPNAHSRRSRARKKDSSKDAARAPKRTSSARYLSFTIDTVTAEIVKLERLDASGARHEISETEKETLLRARDASGRVLEDVLQETFEAGIACAFGADAPQNGNDESDEDAELRRLLLTPLIEHSGARRLMTHDVLNRAIVGTLIQHSMKTQAAGGPSGAER